MTEANIDDSSDTSGESAVGPRVALLGDSVIAGLGVRGRSYGMLVAESLGASHTLRLARSTHTIIDALTRVEKVRDYKPDLILVGVGGADGVVHASATLQKLVERFAPKSWQGVEGLEPRAYYVGTKWTRFRQRVTTIIKVTIKHIGVRMGDGYQRVPLDSFAPKLEELFLQLSEIGCPVIVCGISDSDPRYFPRTEAALVEYRKVMSAASARYDNFAYVDIRPPLKRWDDFISDHIHLNPTGHAKVAELILDESKPLLVRAQLV